MGSERNNVSENIQIRRTNGHSGDAIGRPDSERIRADVRELQLTPESSAQNTTATEIVRKPKDYYKLFADVHLDTKFDYTEAQKIVYATLNLLSIDNNIELDNDNFKTTINELFEKLNTLDSEARENYLKEVAHKTALAYAEENNTAVSEEIESAILSTMETVIDDFGSTGYNHSLGGALFTSSDSLGLALFAPIRNRVYHPLVSSLVTAKGDKIGLEVLNDVEYEVAGDMRPTTTKLIGNEFTISLSNKVFKLAHIRPFSKYQRMRNGFIED